jgi:hypothetical protein
MQLVPLEKTPGYSNDQEYVVCPYYRGHYDFNGYIQAQQISHLNRICAEWDIDRTVTNLFVSNLDFVLNGLSNRRRPKQKRWKTAGDTVVDYCSAVRVGLAVYGKQS